MLRDEVAEAVAVGEFHIWTSRASTRPSSSSSAAGGNADDAGAYPADSVYGLVAAELERFDRVLRTKDEARAGDGWAGATGGLTVSDERRRFLFTLTTGRSGGLSRQAAAGQPAGRRMPPRSPVSTASASTPPTSPHDPVQQSGQRRGCRTSGAASWRASPFSAPVYVETFSHALMKAGLLENLAGLKDLGEIHFVALERDALGP